MYFSKLEIWLKKERINLCLDVANQSNIYDNNYVKEYVKGKRAQVSMWYGIKQLKKWKAYS